MKFKVHVEITVEAESADEAEAGMQGALGNLVGDDFLSYEITDVTEK